MIGGGYISGLGMVPTGKRKVSPVPKRLLGLVPKPVDNNVTVKSSGVDSITDTVPLMRNKIRRTLWQTEKLAKELTGSSKNATARNDWEFIFQHIQYVQDPKGDEQVRSPRRLIYDGKGDCDCFTVTLSSLLLNQKIPHKLRVSANQVAGEWGHIYIVVPKDGNVDKDLDTRSDYIVIDPVVHQFNYEAPFLSKKDFAMKLTSLDGLGEAQQGCNPIPEFNLLRRYVYTEQVVEQGLVPTKQFLKANNIPFTEIVDQSNDSGAFAINTPLGVKRVPTIITKAQAEQVKSMVGQVNGNTGIVPVSAGGSVVTQPNATSNESSPCGKKFPWWWIAAGGAVIGILLSGGKKPGLGSLPMNGPSKSKRKKKKLKPIHI